MATTATTTETKLTLDPPAPAADRRAGAGGGPGADRGRARSRSSTTEVDKFVDELVALDANSPEFGKKVDQLTNMGRKEIAEAAGHSNRFLDRPVKAIDKESGIGADLDRAAPHRRGARSRPPGQAARKPRKLFGIIPFGNRLRDYFTKYQSAQTHISAILAAPRLGQGRAADGQCRDRHRARRICGRRWASSSR